MTAAYHKRLRQLHHCNARFEAYRLERERDKMRCDLIQALKLPIAEQREVVPALDRYAKALNRELLEAKAALAKLERKLRRNA